MRQKAIYIILFFAVISIISCKKYYPDPDAYRDEKLFGTWITLEYLRSKSTQVEVFASDGYGGDNQYVLDYKGDSTFCRLGASWSVEKVENDYDIIHSRNIHWNGRWKHDYEYYVRNDTLIIFREYLRGDLLVDRDTLVKFRLQGIFDGPDCIGVEEYQKPAPEE